MISLLPELPFRTSPGKSEKQLRHGHFPAALRASIKAVFGTGARGIIFSCERAEIWFANLGAAGGELRQIVARQKA